MSVKVMNLHFIYRLKLLDTIMRKVISYSAITRALIKKALSGKEITDEEYALLLHLVNANANSAEVTMNLLGELIRIDK